MCLGLSKHPALQPGIFLVYNKKNLPGAGKVISNLQISIEI